MTLRSRGREIIAQNYTCIQKWPRGHEVVKSWPQIILAYKSDPKVMRSQDHSPKVYLHTKVTQRSRGHEIVASNCKIWPRGHEVVKWWPKIIFAYKSDPEVTRSWDHGPKLFLHTKVTLRSWGREFTATWSARGNYMRSTEHPSSYFFLLLNNLPELRLEPMR